MTPPIADPSGAPTSSEEIRVFRQNFWRVYVGFLLLLAFLAVPVMASVLWFFVPHKHVLKNLNGLIVIYVLFVAVYPFVVAFGATLHVVKVTRFGIQGPAFVGFVEWTQMKSVRVLWLGCLWARIARRNRFAPLWVPLALTDLNGFARTLQEWAPEDNPLRAWAQKRAP